ncbi:MAG: hypothetical protein Q9P01_22225 [Anaerolineae bacterium]|nr:hypothetical protein [Anaerolineae bacterium]MDQ7037456.1 hypothetical protein [Anaerolineae bacterium]
MMKNLYRIRPLHFLLWWVACSVFIWPLAVLMIGLVMVPIAFVMQGVFPYMPDNDIILAVTIAPLMGISISIAIATLQRWLLRNKLYWAADSWRKWTMLGGAVGAIAVYGVVSAVENIFSSYLYYYANDWGTFLMMPVFVLCVAAFQWLSLRHAVKQAWLWILGNAIAGIVFSGLIYRNQSFLDFDSGWAALLIMALAVLGQGFITGFVMLFLFEKKLLPMTPEGQEMDSDRPKSVWDEAI